MLIRAITGHPLETKVFREERSNAKMQVERETAKDVCAIFSRVVFPFMIRMATIWLATRRRRFVSHRSENRVGDRPPLPVFSPLFDRVRFL